MYKITIIADGSYMDEQFSIRTISFRVNETALYDWFEGELERSPSDVRRKWETRILEMFNFKRSAWNCAYIKHIVDDIFTVVFKRKVL